MGTYQPSNKEIKDYQEELYRRYGKHYNIEKIKSGKLDNNLSIEWGDKEVNPW